MSGRDSGRSTARTVAYWLVRRYPQPWRDRYEDEVLALIGESHLRWRDAADLARGFTAERARSIFEPGDRPVVTMLGFFLGLFALGVAMSCGAIAAGMAAAAWLGPIPGVAGEVAWQVFMTCLVVGVWIKRPFPLAAISPALAPATEKARVSLGLAWLTATAFLLAVALTVWAGVLVSPSPLHALWWIYVPVPGFVLGEILLSREPWRSIRAATSQLFASRHDLKWALMELERCERLAADGMASPLEEARASIERIMKSREDALATLHAMGYRARFRPAACASAHPS
jgi:hypothetical protein